MRSWLLVIIGLAGCAHLVSQDEHTGADGWSAGATAMPLVHDVATVTGTVTYPGGDRVDWYYVDIAHPGALDIHFEWTSPRPDLRVLVDVFDRDGVQIVHAKRTAHDHQQRARVPQAVGRIYFRVYAAKREDAGRYTLTATLTPEVIAAARLDIELPPPPPLPEVPAEREWHCDADEPDRPLDACRPVACKPGEVRDPRWPTCRPETCPTPPDINVRACWAVMPCPNPPDRRVKACHPPVPKFDCSVPDPDMPLDACEGGRPEPVIGRVIKLEPAGDDSVITIAAGSSQGVVTSWKGTLLRGDTDQPLAGGEVVILRIDKRVTIVKVHASRDTVTANSRVRFEPR